MKIRVATRQVPEGYVCFILVDPGDENQEKEFLAPTIEVGPFETREEARDAAYEAVKCLKELDPSTEVTFKPSYTMVINDRPRS